MLHRRSQFRHRLVNRVNVAVLPRIVEVFNIYSLLFGVSKMKVAQLVQARFELLRGAKKK
jgi:hypothetical protein